MPGKGMSESGVRLHVQRLPEGADLPLPAYESLSAAGMDLRAAVAAPVILAPGARVLIPTGLAVAVEDGYEMQIRARSGLALKHGIVVAQGTATIDSDYRGPVGVILLNLGDQPFTIERGMRIAQGVIAYAPQAEIIEAASLPPSQRGAGGFGSTGVS